MLRMQIREVTSCAVHERAIIMQEDVHAQWRLTFYADREEARRLAHVIGRSPRAKQPVYDLMQSLLNACQTTATRVVLDAVQGALIGSFLYIQRAESEVAIPCYTTDALALRAHLPIYVTAAALAHAERLASSPSPLADCSEVTQWLAQVKPDDFSSYRGAAEG